MIVDSSALVAIVLAEPGHEVLVQHLARAPARNRMQVPAGTAAAGSQR